MLFRSYFPTGFFRDVKRIKDMDLTIYLIKSVPGNAFSGLTDKEFMDDIRITLVAGDMYSVVHHEIMHYIDAYLSLCMWPGSPEDGWEDLNPPGFQYGSFISSYNYDITKRNTDAFFLNNYGQTNYLEDRATIFGDLMFRAYAPTGCYAADSPVHAKAMLIAAQIKQYFPSVQKASSLRWMRFL